MAVQFAPLTEEHFKEVLAQAHARCFYGKGQERHANPNEAFGEHDFWPLFKRCGSGGPQFQIEKKLQEYRRTMDRKQLLDIINYTAAMICWHDQQNLGGDPVEPW